MAKIKINTSTDSPAETTPVKVDDPGLPKVVSHKGKILDPLNAKKDEPVEGAEKPEPVEKADLKPTPKEVTLEVSAEVEQQPEEPASSQEVEEKLEDITHEIEQADEELKAETEKNSDVQQPQIYDTKQYHLPIKATHHNKQSNAGSALTLVILIVLVLLLAYVAADMDLYDPGFELPVEIL